MPQVLVSEIRFEFDGEVGVCRVYADGTKRISWGDNSFEYVVASAAVRAAITRASTLAVFT